ncbi:MAG: HAMP domain-containing methyl-accepting chemotaxis protein [Actinomycetota bacterium]|nr:HAMP domain-containing methyl-accepting chemotaxis protein [Actinomycetota bacterium]
MDNTADATKRTLGGRFGLRRKALAATVFFLVVVLIAFVVMIILLSVSISRAGQVSEMIDAVDAQKKLDSLEGLLGGTRVLAIVVLVLSVLLAAATMYLLVGWISKGTGEVTWQIQQVAAGDGDLTRQIVVRDRDTFGDLADAINIMIGALRGSVAEIGKIAGELSNSAEQMSAVIQQMNASSQDISSTISHIAKGGEEQARRVLDTSHTMELMSSSMQEIAEKATLSNQASDEAIDIARRGAEAAVETASAMDVIRGAAETVADASSGLEDRFMQIGIIVDVITSVADQTNLLALNAAIEAARAGEQGRGFAVVAEEVRSLAENSRKSAEQISNLIREIQAGVNHMRESIDSAISQVHGGTEVVEKAGKALQEIAVSIESTSRYAFEIAETTQSQVQGNDEALKAITEIASIADETAASSEEASATVQEQTASMQEMAAAATELASMAEKLTQLVGGFKV